MSDKLNIRVTVGGGTYRARVNSSNVIATCTMGAEKAAEAVLAKWNKSGNLTTDWTVRLVDQDQGDVSTWYQFEATPVEAAGKPELPKNTCVKWPHRSCGGGCDDKTCCRCQEEFCNKRQLCHSRGIEPHHDHEVGWPVPPPEETEPSESAITAVPAVPANIDNAPAPCALAHNAPAHVTALQRSGGSKTLSQDTTVAAGDAGEAGSALVQFAAGANIVDTLRLALELDLPASVDLAGVYIRAQARNELRSGQRAAVVSALIRMERFPAEKQYKAYCSWMLEHAGVAWRQAITYQNAGMLLLSPAFTDLPKAGKEALLLCTPAKLEVIATAGPERLPVLAADPGLAELSVAELRNHVAVTGMTERQQKLLADAKEKQAQKAAFAKSPAGRFSSAVAEILQIREVLTPEAVTDPLAVITAGLALQKAGLERQEISPEITLAKLAEVAENIEAAREFVLKLLGGK